MIRKPSIHCLGASHGGIMPGMPRYENRRGMLRRTVSGRTVNDNEQPGWFGSSRFWNQGTIEEQMLSYSVNYRLLALSCSSLPRSVRIWHLIPVL
jgi:hypothetical protein